MIETNTDYFGNIHRTCMFVWITRGTNSHQVDAAAVSLCSRFSHHQPSLRKCDFQTTKKNGIKNKLKSTLNENVFRKLLQLNSFSVLVNGGTGIKLLSCNSFRCQTAWGGKSMNESQRERIAHMPHTKHDQLEFIDPNKCSWNRFSVYTFATHRPTPQIRR